LKARTARDRKLRRYLQRLCKTRPDSVAPPCLERWHNRRVTRAYARLRNDRPVPVMPARAWYRHGMEERLGEARRQAAADWAGVFGLSEGTGT
jgi:hypothetical protein